MQKKFPKLLNIIKKTIINDGLPEEGIKQYKFSGISKMPSEKTIEETISKLDAKAKTKFMDSFQKVQEKA